MSEAKTNLNALDDEELSHLAGGSIPVDEIDLPLDELMALKGLDGKLIKKALHPDLTKDRFWDEIAPGLSPHAITGLLKIGGHEEWMSRGGMEGISGK